MLAAIALYYAVDRWNEWWLGMLFVRKPDLLPLQYLVRNMLASASSITQAVPQSALQNVFPTGIQMAAVVLSMAPIVCVYPFLQKYFVKGLTLGSVKM
jgi:putative aldouronate transport system permease protein